jgi:hypothetical protein
VIRRGIASRPAGCRTIATVGSLAALVLLAAAPAASGHASTGAAAAGPGELVYVANADAGAVTAHAASSSGPVSPSRRNRDPNDPNTYWDPWGVTFDAGHHLYVQTFLSDATSFVFAPGAMGKDQPKRIFVGGGPDTRSIAVDGSGYEYIATGESSAEIDVLPPHANGRPGDLYHVQPLRTIPTDEATWFPWPDILTTDAENEVLAALVRSQGNAVEVFEGGPQGPSSPIRTITGPHTHLGTCPGQPCDQVAVTSSSLTGLTYVAVSESASTRICEFAANADGDARPVRIIEGPNTRFAGMVITGIAVSPRTGEVYVMVKRAQFGTGEVDVFARHASGDAAPERTFTDSTSGFVDAQGIAISR